MGAHAYRRNRRRGAAPRSHGGPTRPPPAHSVGEPGGCTQVAKHIRHHVEDLLLKYGVDVVVSGHVHSHSRSCPVVDTDCADFAAGAVLHVVTGSGGHKLSKISTHQPQWVQYARRSWGYSRFTVRAHPGAFSRPRGCCRLWAWCVDALTGARGCTM